MTTLFCLIIAFSFFAQSVMGFGGGLIANPALSIFMPVQDAVTVSIIFQFSMGLIILKTYKDTCWKTILSMVPAMVIGVAVGIYALKAVPGDVLRILLAIYIILHLLRANTSFDPLAKIFETKSPHFSGFMGGMLNAVMGAGGPAFVIFLRNKARSAAELRADVTAIMFLTNIPRLFGAFATDMMRPDLLMLGLYAFPGFLCALILGHFLYDKIPQKMFFRMADILLALSAIMLLLKVGLNIFSV